jgi:hypothetical protein
MMPISTPEGHKSLICSPKYPNLCIVKVYKTKITMQTEQILKEARARFAEFRNEMPGNFHEGYTGSR